MKQIVPVKKSTCLTFLLLSIICTAFGQNTIKGKVTLGRDSTGTPGITVRLGSTNIGTLTSATGDFILSVPDSLAGKKIKIITAYIGYVQNEIELTKEFFTNNKSLKVNLAADTQSMTEVVVIGTSGHSHPKPQDKIPAFPWPPPAFSAESVLNRIFFQNARKLSDIDIRLTTALKSLGYADISYYYIPNGFALVTRIEQIQPNGISFNAPDRWSARTRTTTLNWKNYLQNLIFPQQGYFRIIVFAITNKAFTSSGHTVNRHTAENWLNEGLNVLPSSIGDKKWTSSYNCTAMIYEFIKPESGEATLLTDGPTGDEHLTKAKILIVLNQ